VDPGLLILYEDKGVYFHTAKIGSGILLSLDISIVFRQALEKDLPALSNVPCLPIGPS